MMIGNGGVFILFPVQSTILWPLVNSSSLDHDKAKVLHCCRMTDSALTTLRWIEFDNEMIQVGPEEACLTAMRFLMLTSLPLELPLEWGKIDPMLAVDAIVSLANEVTESNLSMVLWKEPLMGDGGKNVLSGTVTCHAAACAIRTGVEGAYRLLRSLLCLCYALLESNHQYVKHFQRQSLRSSVHKVANIFRSISSLRAASRAPSSVSGYIIPFASACRSVSNVLSDLSAKNYPLSKNFELISAVSLYAWFVASSFPGVLFMRALAACKEFNALYQLVNLPGIAAISPTSYYAGCCLLARGELEASLKKFENAVLSAEAAGENSFEYQFLSLISKDPKLEISFPPDRYWLAVAELYESYGQAEMVVKASRLALRKSKNSKIFWNLCFRHNLLLRRYSDAYLDIEMAYKYALAFDADAETANEYLIRRLRKFVVEIVAQKNVTELCEFSFIGNRIAIVSSILLELGSVSDVSNDQSVNYYKILYAFHIQRSQYKAAASVMYEYALRVKSEAESLQVASNALVSSIFALGMVPKDMQWIEIAKKDGSKDVVSLKRIEQENEVLKARITLRHCSLTVGMEERDAFALLVSKGKICQAIVLGKMFDLDLTLAFEAMTRNILSGSKVFGTEDDEYRDSFENGQHPWELIKDLIIQYDSRKSNFGYAQSILRLIFEEDSTVKPPVFLVEFLKENHIESLLYIFLSFGLYEDAYKVCLSILDDQNKILPLNLFDKLILKLKDREMKENLSRKIYSTLKTKK